MILGMTTPFTFLADAFDVSSARELGERARAAEDLGVTTFVLPDHLVGQPAPVPYLAAVAALTERVRISAFVHNNDLRHPAVLAQELATLDALSEGRLDVAIGAGWNEAEYAAIGLPFDPVRVRQARLAESVAVLKGCFGPDPFSFAGDHYTITDHDAQPKPVQQPHPPIMIGGGGKQVLRFAAREADIISVNFNLREGAVGASTMATGTAEATADKIGWIKDAAGARYDDIELNVTIFVTIVTDDAAKMAERVAAGFGTTPEELPKAPHALIGSVDQIVDELQRRRDEYGFSYVAFSGDVFEQVAPIVAKLAGK